MSFPRVYGLGSASALPFLKDYIMQNIVILGGGTAGWIAASGLARVLLKNGSEKFNIKLIESDEIGTIGVGEATIPSILEFIQFLNIDQLDFIKNTDATFKLGIQFNDWLEIGHSYFHPFGTLGPEVDNKPLFQHWMREKLNGSKLELMDLSIASHLAKNNKFLSPTQQNQICNDNFGYALHFDAALVAKYLKDYALQIGVEHINSKVSGIKKDAKNNICALIIDENKEINGDFFIDCSGFKSIILGEALETKYEDWSHYLPCDSAYAIQTDEKTSLNPYTKSTARDAGWTWQIPLRTRMGNGYVYSSEFVKDDDALNTLLNSIKGNKITEPRKIKFKAGAREVTWKNNCLALGLSSGFLEPLESTSIHLVISNLYRFLDLFPSGDNWQILQQKFNKAAKQELEEIRDFIILHYCKTQRQDTKFWQYCKNMQIPQSLAKKIEFFEANGKISTDYYDLFKPTSWISVLIGMGVDFKTYDALVDAIKPEFSQKILQNFVQIIGQGANSSPYHADILKKL